MGNMSNNDAEPVLANPIPLLEVWLSDFIRTNAPDEDTYEWAMHRLRALAQRAAEVEQLKASNRRLMALARRAADIHWMGVSPELSDLQLDARRLTEHGTEGK